MRRHESMRSQDRCSKKLTLSSLCCSAGVLFCAGPVPKELGALTELKELSLFKNNLTGKECVRSDAYRCSGSHA